jgi:hypothetical protein
LNADLIPVGQAIKVNVARKRRFESRSTKAHSLAATIS